MMRVFLFIFSFLFVQFTGISLSFAVDKNDPRVVFLVSMQTLRADFLQKQYDEKKIIEANGKILVKKPSSVLLEHNGDNMRLKFSSINGNVKMLDSDLGQTTYFDNQYSDLIQFFTNNIKPERLLLNANKDLCLPFEHLEQYFLACLDINLSKKTITKLSLYIHEFDKKNKKKMNDKIYKVFDVFFKNVEINGEVDDSEFILRDNRIFNEDEDE